MSHIGILSNSDSLFYTTSLILVLEYLHERNILYRDLKPENVMIDSEGFIKLIDFNTSKILQGRTYTIIGTPFYMAPEVIVGRGYGKSSDLWSLGILIYEFMCGKVPFGHTEENTYRVYEEILSSELVFPLDVPQLSENCMGLIRQLLDKFSESRVNDTIEKIKINPWLNDVEWEELYCKNTIPPYKPTSKSRINDYEYDSFQSDIQWDIDIKNDSAESPDPADDDTESEAFKRILTRNWDHEFSPK
jgi:cGMP-dependent protein kinase 1